LIAAKQRSWTALIQNRAASRTFAGPVPQLGVVGFGERTTLVTYARGIVRSKGIQPFRCSMSTKNRLQRFGKNCAVLLEATCGGGFERKALDRERSVAFIRSVKRDGDRSTNSGFIGRGEMHGGVSKTKWSDERDH
jgi:hypothetical protein